MPISTQWIEPIKPWPYIQRRFFEDKLVDAAAFARKHNLDEADVRDVITGKCTVLSPALCAALSSEKGVPVDVFLHIGGHPQQVAV